MPVYDVDSPVHKIHTFLHQLGCLTDRTVPLDIKAIHDVCNDYYGISEKDELQFTQYSTFDKFTSDITRPALNRLQALCIPTNSVVYTVIWNFIHKKHKRVDERYTHDIFFVYILLELYLLTQSRCINGVNVCSTSLLTMKRHAKHTMNISKVVIGPEQYVVYMENSRIYRCNNLRDVVVYHALMHTLIHCDDITTVFKTFLGVDNPELAEVTNSIYNTYNVKPIWLHDTLFRKVQYCLYYNLKFCNAGSEESCANLKAVYSTNIEVTILHTLIVYIILGHMHGILSSSTGNIISNMKMPDLVMTNISMSGIYNRWRINPVYITPEKVYGAMDLSGSIAMRMPSIENKHWIAFKYDINSIHKCQNVYNCLPVIMFVMCTHKINIETAGVFKCKISANSIIEFSRSNPFSVDSLLKIHVTLLENMRTGQCCKCIQECTRQYGKKDYYITVNFEHIRYNSYITHFIN